MPENFQYRHPNQAQNIAPKVRRSGLFFLFALLLSAGSTLAYATTYTVGIAPSLPKPAAKLEEGNNPVDRRSLGSKLIKETRKQHSELITEDDAKKDTQNEEQYFHDVPTKKQAWRQILKHLSEKTGVAFEPKFAKSQLSFERNLAKGIYDLAYITPLQFVAFNEQPGYKAIAKRKSQPLRGMVFVKKIGPYKTLTDLRDKELVFPGLLDFAASVGLRASLKKLKMNVIPKFVSSQDEAYQSVLLGKYPGGAGTEETFAGLPVEVQNGLRVIWESPGYTPPAFVGHPRMPFFTINKLQRALVRMNKTEEGREMLDNIFVANGFEVARDSDWHDVAEIDVYTLNGQDIGFDEPTPNEQTSER